MSALKTVIICFHTLYKNFPDSFHAFSLHDVSNNKLRHKYFIINFVLILNVFSVFTINKSVYDKNELLILKVIILLKLTNL